LQYEDFVHLSERNRADPLILDPFQVLDNYDSLIMAAEELGIDDVNLERALNELQEVEFICVIKNGSIIKKSKFLLHN